MASKYSKPPAKTTLAVQDDKVLATPGTVRDRLLAQMAKGGAKTVRYNVIYGQTAGGTNLQGLDSVIDAAKRYGMTVQPTLMADPRYAPPGGGLTYANNDPKLWAQFAQNVAQRERGRVRRYEVGNEPNYPAFVAGADKNPRAAGRTYRQLYRATYGALKGVDPSTQVLLGSVTSGGGDPRQFLQGLLGGKPLHAAGFSYHPYDNQMGRWDINTLGALQQTLGRYKRQGQLQTAKGQQAPLYLTEMGYQRGSMPEAQRLALSAQAYAKAQKAGARQFVQYQLTDKTGTQQGPSGYGLTPGPRSAATDGGGWDTSVGSASGDLSGYLKALRKYTKR
jgi:hypothetical protein